jgi:predicted GH43/DUF377 family glycosyl hydrolase
MKQFFYFLCLFSYGISQETEIDLEQNKSEFVLKTFQIHIPNYPNAFNPSIIKWKNGILFSFRVILDEKLPYNSNLGLVWLDEEFQPLHEPQLLNTQIKQPQVPSRAEDGRLIVLGESLYLVYSNCVEEKISRKGFRVHVAEILYDGENFQLEDLEPILYFEGESSDKREKNWTPFDYEGNLFLSYSISPHLVFHPLKGTYGCETISLSPDTIDWPLGELRGGTPAFLDKDKYLSFFHSCKKMSSVHSNGKETLHYFMGAYLFQKDPPFQITHINSSPIIGENFYIGSSYTPYWHPVQAIFPCGFIQDDPFIWIAYGRQDHECWIAKLDKEGLMREMKVISHFDRVNE